MPTKPKIGEAAEEPKGKNQPAKFETHRRVLLATIGAAALVQDEIKSLVDRLVDRGETAKKDGKKLVREVMDERKSRAAKVEEEISKHLESVLDRMNIPTKADMETLNQKITALSKKIDGLKKP